jgi:hypothetical protein
MSAPITGRVFMSTRRDVGKLLNPKSPIALSEAHARRAKNGSSSIHTRAIQMNNSKTPKIVVGVGLVAAYAAGLTFLTLRDAPEGAVAPSQTSALSAQMAAAPALPPMGTTESASTAALAPEASAAVETPAPGAAVVANVAKAPEVVRPAAATPAPML